MLDEPLGEHPHAQLGATDDVGAVAGSDVRDVHRRGCWVRALRTRRDGGCDRTGHTHRSRPGRDPRYANAADPQVRGTSTPSVDVTADSCRRARPAAPTARHPAVLTRAVRAAAYQIILQRPGDPAGVRNYVEHLRNGTLTTAGVLDEMLTSMELRQNVPYRDRLRSLHLSRCDFVRMLPRGANPGSRRHRPGQCRGLARLDGLPVRLPGTDDRRPAARRPPRPLHPQRGVERVQSALGPVEYRYHSMVDLSAYVDASCDLVFSGESIEHVTEAEARMMLAEVRRVVAPDGWFCLDTPNRRATALDLGEQYSNPDHKVEYTDAQVARMLVDAGFTIEARYGLSYVGESLAKGEFDARNRPQPRRVR